MNEDLWLGAQHFQNDCAPSQILDSCSIFYRFAVTVSYFVCHFGQDIICMSVELVYWELFVLIHCCRLVVCFCFDSSEVCSAAAADPPTSFVVV